MSSNIKYFRTFNACFSFLVACGLCCRDNRHFFVSSRIRAEYEEIEPMFAHIERVGNNKYAIELNYVHSTGTQSGWVRTNHYLNEREFNFWSRGVRYV